MKKREFLGDFITENEIQPDPIKVEAIIKMPNPQNISKLKQIQVRMNV